MFWTIGDEQAVLLCCGQNDEFDSLVGVPDAFGRSLGNDPIDRVRSRKEVVWSRYDPSPETEFLKLF